MLARSRLLSWWCRSNMTAATLPCRLQRRAFMSSRLSTRFREQVQTPGESQERLLEHLERLRLQLRETDSVVVPASELTLQHTRDRQLKGLYIYGSVGTGKTCIMDTFYSVCQEDEHTFTNRGVMRNHFHDFMLNLHHRSHLFKQKEPLGDAIPAVAMEVAQEARVLCLDEFQVTNIADAMLLKRMFHVLFDLGVILITTSNRAPESLYEHGLNRGLFLPFIDELKEQCVVFNMDSSRDYRQDARELKKFYYINTSLEAAYDSFTKGTVSAETVLPVMMGRSLTVSRATETCAWFTFGELCRTALGAPDFIALATRFSHVFLVDVPQLTCHEETRRFITLVDALYEHRVKLHISASCSLEDLFVVFQKQSAGQSNTDAATYNHVNVSTETTVVSEGGSSSSNATTMFLQDEKPVEWSSTGLIDASMAQLTPATNNETSFMQTRAASRIAEMTSASWHEQQ